MIEWSSCPEHQQNLAQRRLALVVLPMTVAAAAAAVGGSAVRVGAD